MGASRRKIELDIGCGARGRFALAAALENPDVLIIGIDINEQSFASAEAARRHLDVDNVQFVHSEAHAWLAEFVPDRTIDAFHLYFPTPYMGTIRSCNVLGGGLNRWLFTIDFVREIQRAAVPGAILRVVTDHQPYFENVQSVAAEAELDQVDWSSPLHDKPLNYLVGTGCERQMRWRDKRIYRAQYLLL